MFPNLLSSSPLVWGGLVVAAVAIPVLIHLINQLRYRPVRWAAMDFLMASHHRNRKQVRLKQILLIAARMAALLLILATVSRAGCRDSAWTGWLGKGPTHHYVLVDDSYSMGEQADGSSPLDRGRDVLGFLAEQIGQQDQQRLTVIRYSEARRQEMTDRPSPGGDNAGGSEPPPGGISLNGMEADRETGERIRALANRLEPTGLSTGPRPALELTRQLIAGRPDEQAIVYILSDFRQRDWNPDVAPRAALDILRQSGAGLQLVQCATAAGSNLAITRLETDGAVQVAGIPLQMTVEIRNPGPDTRRNVPVKIATATYPEPASAAADPELIEQVWNELPALRVDKIAPGESVVRRFPVFFEQPGQQAVRAELPVDDWDADNRRWSVTRVKTASRVLLVDDPPLDDARKVALALNPGGLTGIRTVAGTSASVRDMLPEQLVEFDCVFLLDIPRLDRQTIESLKQYVCGGGGLVFFCGPDCQLPEYTRQLYEGGQGLFPLPLERVATLPLSEDPSPPDIVTRAHPIFAHVHDIRNSPLDLVQVQRVCQPPTDWTADSDQVEVLATVRGQPQWPLVVERSMDHGRIVAVLTTAGPAWNNWCRNGTFPASLLLLHDHVARGRIRQEHRQTGQPVRVPGDPSGFQPEYRIVVPGSSDTERVVWKKRAPVNREGTVTDHEQISAEESGLPGIHEVWRQSLSGIVDATRIAVNPDTSESDPRRMPTTDLATSSGLSGQSLSSWQDFQPAVAKNESAAPFRILLFTLIGILIAEQVLALLNSYHPTTRN